MGSPIPCDICGKPIARWVISNQEEGGVTGVCQDCAPGFLGATPVPDQVATCTLCEINPADVTVVANAGGEAMGLCLPCVPAWCEITMDGAKSMGLLPEKFTDGKAEETPVSDEEWEASAPPPKARARKSRTAQSKQPDEAVAETAAASDD